MSDLAPIDWFLLGGYLAAVMLLGSWLGRGQKGAADYFLGNRQMPWWVVLLSIVATETSTVTFLSVPAKSYVAGGDLRFLQLTFGYIVGRFLVVILLLPQYFQGNLFTAYEVLGEKLGEPVRVMASMLFIGTRTVADGLRLFLTSLVLRAVLDLELEICVAIIGVATIVYTVLGGIRSVMWNDCIQFVVYMFGAVLAAAVLVENIPGGWASVTEFAVKNEKLHVLDFSTSLSGSPVTFWSGLIGGAFLSFATHGADQLMVQRYLTARSKYAASLALISSGVIVLLQFLLFLLIGVGLAAFYNELPVAERPTGDEAFITFIVSHVGFGLVGIILAAIFSAAMSTLSSSLNSSATSLVNDLLLRNSKAEDQAKKALWLGRIATVVFGLLQMGVAIATYRLAFQRQIVDQVLAVAGFTTGLILGLYLFGLVAKKISKVASFIGFAVGFIVVSFVAFKTDISWPWYTVVGTMSTLTAALAANSVGLKMWPELSVAQELEIPKE